MRILWITNILFPEPSKRLGLSESIGGGWMISQAYHLAEMDNIELAIASTAVLNKIHVLDCEGIKYYVLPSKSKVKYQKSLELLWDYVREDFHPDIVHIHGTEFSIGLSFIRTSRNRKYVVSIQGLVSVCERYYCGGMDYKSIVRAITVRDILKRDTILQARESMKKRGILEREYLKNASHIVGRTSWDYSHAKIVNPGINYHFCNECLRKEFYNLKWELSMVKKYSIFMSQGLFPYKGLHMSLKALSIVKREYAAVKLFIAGGDITKPGGLRERAKLSGYGKYIRKLIVEFDLTDNVVFVGTLNASEMAQMYLKSHLFVSASAIENSPNSLGEAQLVGTPSVVSNVGGVPDMVVDGESALLYRYEEYEVLAFNILRLFADNSLAQMLSTNGRKSAIDRHDLQKNTERIFSIYNEIIEKEGARCF